MNRQREIAVAAVSGLGAAVATGETLWGVIGAVGGLLVVLVLEWVYGLRRQARGLAEVERQLEHERRDHEAKCEMLTRRAEDAERNAAVSAVWTGVWGGAFTEAIETGHILPMDAIMARAEMELKAKRLDKPPERGSGGPQA